MKMLDILVQFFSISTAEMILPLDSLRGCLWEQPGRSRADGILLAGKTRGRLCTAAWDASRGIVALGDKRGSVFCLYMKQNRFSLAREFPHASTALLILDEALVTAHGHQLSLIDVFTHENIFDFQYTKN